MFPEIFLVIALIALLVVGLNRISYRWLAARILRRRKWDLNICCGRTDGGGINVDIVDHAGVPNLVIVDDVYRLPFAANQFEHTLCSHTIEHVEDPEAFFEELRRVSRHVTLVVPPLWDLAAAFNVLEHRTLFLTLRKEHDTLPRRVPLPGARHCQERWGQRIRA